MIKSARALASTIALTNFRLAIERQWNGADGAPFTTTGYTIVAWEGLAE
jgi:hypothetical protein